MQVVLVYLQSFRHNSALKHALHPKIAKNSLKPLFEGLRSFVDKSKKPVTSLVCTYLQPFLHYTSQ